MGSRSNGKYKDPTIKALNQQWQAEARHKNRFRRPPKMLVVKKSRKGKGAKMYQSRPLRPCRHPGCGKISRTRELCYPHYAALQKKVKKGLLSWEQAIAQGLCAPALPRQTWMRDFARGLRRGQ